MPNDFLLSSNVLANGRTAHYAKLNNSQETRFLIGYKTQYERNFGIYNTATTASLTYDAEAFIAEFGFWALFIAPTAAAESQNSFICLNTYDRAKFTFSFMQYAAHVPNGDFVIFFKKLLALPNAAQYFPKLKIINGRINYVNATNTATPLESDTTTRPLMDYLNPTLADVENQELICAARMVHWATTDAAHRRIQVETGINHFKNNMPAYHQRFGLNNAPAKVCAMICDIRHQGRGLNDRIANALNTNGDWEKAYTNLCTVGATNYQTRINTVRNTIKRLGDAGLFNKKYKASNNSFI
jgi:hypothetical protein